MSICSGKWRSFGVVKVFVCIITLCGSPCAYPQAGPTPLPIPAATDKLGRYDAAAVAEVLAHLKVVGTAPWTGMQGTGTITYGSDQNSYSATLTIVGSSRSRLDIQTATGSISTRINSRLGNIQHPDGKSFPLAPEIAASGIVQFELPRLADLQTRSSVLDHGVTVIDGMNLHRVTIEQPLTPKKNIATDLYFDPETHLLVKTANAIRPDGSQSELLRVVTYGDYRAVDGVMVPFLYRQVLDGQKQWTIQFSEVQLNPNLQSNYFEF
ncbi:DUF4292 domain-containing protein [Terriglobus albidus]|uniref:DUF4292 domain-containing protein n=1 Tax=Terriglobus albidus TaxID=1592106 RepID=UPI0021E08256|nr:DUF4292 domain-containing protein [Terriglobus albidus]